MISIGTLAAHPLWNERAEMRSGHCTTTLIEAGEARILVDPSLPARALAARLSERTPVRPDEITHVFLSNFQPDHRRALDLFPGAAWLMHEPELHAAAAVLDERLHEAQAVGDDESAAIFQRDRRVLQTLRAAPDRLAPAVDLFPLPGVTPGNCGLILSLPRLTIVVVGDAIPTIEHLEQGKVLGSCVDLEQAMESFREVIEIADVVVPGRDNVVLSPVRRRRD